MRTIWKYNLTPDCILEMPIGAKILTIQSQYGDPVLWALVDPGALKERRSFRTYGTGQPVCDHPGEYIGTFQHSGGALIFHVFEEGPIAKVNHFLQENNDREAKRQ